MKHLDVPPKRPINNPTHCKRCEIELTPKLRYIYVGRVHTVCRPCKSIIARTNYLKKKKLIDECRVF